MNQIVSSRNLFIDTSKDVGEGDNCDINLSNNSIRAMDGQALKLTLVNYQMHAPFYTVNNSNNNCTMICKIQASGLTSTRLVRIESKNYPDVNSIALAFAERVRLAVQSTVQTLTNDPANNATAKGINGIEVEPTRTDTFQNGKRILGITITFDNPHLLSDGDFQLFCDENDGEMFELLGADKITDTDATSFDISLPDDRTILIQGRYPMQRSTSSSVYLRLLAPSNNIESAALSGRGPYDTHSLSSNIIGIFEQSGYEFIHYESRNDEYFAFLQTKEINNLRLVLTDKRNRPIGRRTGTSTQTAAGSGFFQSTRGNLNFQCVLRIDTLQVSVPQMLSVDEHRDQKKGGVIVNLPSQPRFASFVK